MADQRLRTSGKRGAATGDLPGTPVGVQAANADLANLLASTGIATVFVDQRLRIRRFAPAAGALLKLTPDSLGCPLAEQPELIGDGDLLTHARQVLAGGATVEHEVPDRAGRCYSRRIAPYYNEEGRIEGAVITYFDITERKHAERELKKLNERLEARVAERTLDLERQKLDILRQQQLLTTMLRSVSEGVVIVDCNGRVLMENEAAMRIVGYSAREVSPRRWCEAVGAYHPPGERPLMPEEMPTMRACRGEEVRGLELVLRGVMHDRTVLIEVRASPLRDVDGEIVGAIANFNDITAQRRAAAVEARLAALVRSTRAAVMTWDTAGKIIDWNDGASHLFGYAAEDIVGRDVAVLTMAGERRALGGAEDPAQPLHDRELVMRHKDGHPVHVAWTATLVRDKSGRIVGGAGVGADMSERARLERQIEQLADAQRRHLRRQVHDSLGQQLTALGLLVGTLQARLVADKSVNQVMASIQRSVDQAKQQLRAILKGLAPVEIQADGLQVALAELARTTTMTHGMDCRFDCPAGVSVLDNFTANELYLIAREAVHNAVKHGRPNTVVIRLEDWQEGLRLQVCDDGVGIELPAAPAEEGLGLRIMRYRSKLMDGSFDVERGANGGTVVTCTLRTAGRRLSSPGA